MKRITDEQIGQIEWNSATLDMSFVDDYPEEVRVLLDAQLASCETECKALREQERRAIGEWLDSERSLAELESGISALKQGKLPEGIVIKEGE